MAKSKSYLVLNDTWLNGKPVTQGQTLTLTDEEAESGLAGKNIEVVDTSDDKPARPNGITEPIANAQHTSITQDSVRKIQGEVTGDANETVGGADAKKSK